MIVTVLAVLHILICVFLILLIMIQDPKGGQNSLFGAGGSNTLLGTSGGADFMTKLTRYTAIIFVGICVALTIATRPSATGVFSKSALPVSTQAPVEPVPEDASAPQSATSQSAETAAKTVAPATPPKTTAPATSEAPPKTDNK